LFVRALVCVCVFVVSLSIPSGERAKPDRNWEWTAPVPEVLPPLLMGFPGCLDADRFNGLDIFIQAGLPCFR